MNIVFIGADLARLGILLYILAWLAFVCYLHIYSKQENINVHKAEKWYSITVDTRNREWVGAALEPRRDDINNASQSGEVNKFLAQLNNY